MKKKLMVFVLVLVVLVGVSVYYFGGEEENLYNDGVYQSIAQGHTGELEVIIEIKDNSITDVEIEHSDTLGISDIAAENIPLEIIHAEDSIEAARDIEVVSGATNTSKGIIEALHQALDEAQK